jgi:hypothetical protein
MDALDGERSDLLVFGNIGQEVHRALGVRESIRVDEVVLRSIARSRVVRQQRLAAVQPRIEEAGDDLLGEPGVGGCAARLRFRRDDFRKLIEKPAHVRRERRGELVECTLEIGPERRIRERGEQRAAEVERAQF